MVFLSIQNITLTFGKIKALDNISIDLEKGGYLVVVGPSGAGKTSLLKVISGLYTANSGKVIVDSKEITKLNPEERSVAFMPQSYALFSKMNVYDNVSYGPKLQSKPKEEIELISNSILSMVHLEKRKDAFPHELSGGMKQRTALARALATHFPILLLDEPLRALDARLRIELRTELKRIVKKLGFTVLHVTHDQNEAMAVADRILILNEGKIVQIGNQADIYYNPASVFVSAFMDEINHLEGIIVEKNLIDAKLIPNGINNANGSRNGTNSFYNYVIETPEGDVIRALTTKDFEIKDPIDVIIKAESIRVKTQPVNGNNATVNSEKESNGVKKSIVLGNLDSKYFLGNWSMLKVATGNFQWTIKLPSVRAQRYELGEKLNLSYKPLDVILLSKANSSKNGGK